MKGWSIMNKKLLIKEEPITVATKVKETIITNQETVDAMKEADHIAKHGSRVYKSFKDVLKDVLGNE